MISSAVEKYLPLHDATTKESYQKNVQSTRRSQQNVSGLTIIPDNAPLASPPNPQQFAQDMEPTEESVEVCSNIVCYAECLSLQLKLAHNIFHVLQKTWLSAPVVTPLGWIAFLMMWNHLSTDRKSTNWFLSY